MQLNNYTQINNEFITNMSNYSGNAVKVFMAISRKTIGWHKVSDRISNNQLMGLTGIKHHSTLQKAIEELKKDGWIIQTQTENGYIYDLNILENEVSKIDTMSNNDIVPCQKLAPPMSKIDIDKPNTMSKIDTTKETIYNKEILIKETIKEIINYFNLKANKNYKLKNKNFIIHISARINDGFILNDFKKVIDIKCLQWLKDIKMQKYLRPETLFGSKFESYLNENYKQNINPKPLNGTEWGSGVTYVK